MGLRRYQKILGDKTEMTVKSVPEMPFSPVHICVHQRPSAVQILSQKSLCELKSFVSAAKKSDFDTYGRVDFLESVIKWAREW
jgi:hypothetical protein